MEPSQKQIRNEVDQPAIFESNRDALFLSSDTIAILEPSIPSIDVSESHNIRQSTDFEALECWMCRSGSTASATLPL